MVGWPEEAGPPPGRREWRETVRNAADFALLGILTAVAAAPVVTAGAAAATASAAVHDWATTQSFPDLRTCARRYVRAIVPGLGATAVAAVTVWLLAVDLSALRAGRVPGGTPLLVATAVLAALAAGLAGLIIVAVGRRGGQGWRAAAAEGVRGAYERPAALLAATGVVTLATLIGLMVLPPLIPVLLGYALLALHGVTAASR
ncbi:hypothetical protein [Rhizomonospora bruguierae]|uniref:hypothetical protein n=1 Tax=Rhizomonospora bruguierae TaxID=1581705 RepID=UPI0020C17F7C|nr:hypothetical protein [Micromonospora sp. NBRC 107566]